MDTGSKVDNKMKVRYRSIILVLLMVPFVSICQQTINPFVQKVKFPNGIQRCSTMEMDSIRRANNPELPSLEASEIWLQQKIAEYKNIYLNNKSLKGTILTIPVVVHVIHNGDAIGVNENISDAQVMSQIQVLNQDFRRMIGTNGYNIDSVGGDMEIEFCLAQFDTAGNAFNGIDRVNLSQATWTTTGVTSTVKPSTYWDPTKYFNLWVVDFGTSGVLGFSQFPDNSTLSGLNSSNGSASTDGVVVGYKYFGSIDIDPLGTYTTPYDKGRTVTHEVGHWLGLRHIWGDGACGVDDFCNDTPLSDAGHFGCTPISSCSTPDMIENYMDYTDDACMNIFTLDQKTRMRTVLTFSPRRMELLNSTLCGTLANVDAGIELIIDPVGPVCSSNIIFPVVNLKNFGSDTLYSVNINYNIDGGTNNNFIWTGVLLPGSVISVFLPNMTTVMGTHTFTAYTSSPNNITDGNSSNDFASSNFTLLGMGVIPGAGVPDTVKACPNQPVFISAFGGDTYYWSGADSILDPYAATIEVTVDSSTIYYVNISTNSGCYQYDSTQVVIDLMGCGLGKINNNVFSPDGDGVNEGFVMDIPELLVHENKVSIYNRWGDIIREFANYNNNDVIWKGMDKNGNIVSSGTYFYVIEIPDVNYSNSGWIQVVR